MSQEEKQNILHQDLFSIYFNLDNLSFNEALILRLTDNQIKEIIDKHFRNSTDN